MVPDEDGRGLQVQEGHRQSLGLEGEVEDVGGGDEADAAVGLADQPAAILEVADGSDELLLVRGEDVVLSVSVDARRAVLGLPDAVEVEEDGLDVVLVLEEEGALDGFGQLVHLL